MIMIVKISDFMKEASTRGQGVNVGVGVNVVVNMPSPKSYERKRKDKIMDWMDFFFGMLVGVELCEDEREEFEQRNSRSFDYEDEFEQYLFERKFIGNLK